MLFETGGGPTQEGGLWVNLGPLLYHWADAHSYLPGEELSIELALDAVIRACHAGGFRTLQNSTVPSVFNGNLRYSPPQVPHAYMHPCLDDALHADWIMSGYVMGVASHLQAGHQLMLVAIPRCMVLEVAVRLRCTSMIIGALCGTLIRIVHAGLCCSPRIGAPFGPCRKSQETREESASLRAEAVS